MEIKPTHCLILVLLKSIHGISPCIWRIHLKVIVVSCWYQCDIFIWMAQLESLYNNHISFIYFELHPPTPLQLIMNYITKLIIPMETHTFVSLLLLFDFMSFIFEENSFTLHCFSCFILFRELCDFSVGSKQFPILPPHSIRFLWFG